MLSLYWMKYSSLLTSICCPGFIVWVVVILMVDFLHCTVSHPGVKYPPWLSTHIALIFLYKTRFPDSPASWMSAWWRPLWSAVGPNGLDMVWLTEKALRLFSLSIILTEPGVSLACLAAWSHLCFLSDLHSVETCRLFQVDYFQSQVLGPFHPTIVYTLKMCVCVCVYT